MNYPLTLDSAGNLYGTTAYGGGGAGVVYRVTPGGQQTVLHSFNGADGDSPQGFVALDKEGNVYGTTLSGGAFNQGVLYKVNASGGFIILHTFVYDATGGEPFAGPTLDSGGNLYGSTSAGGDFTCSKSYPSGCGVVYEFNTAGIYTVLHTFEGGVTDGAIPEGEVLLDSKGDIYGTAPIGGAAGSGIVYKITVRR